MVYVQKSGIPAYYEQIDTYNGLIRPSSVHPNNNALALTFEKYLLQEVFSVYQFDGMPDDWNIDFFRYCLFMCGHIGVINTDKYGVICMNGTPQGRGLYYEPTNYLIANPLLQGILRPRIGQECSVIKIMPNWSGMYDLVHYYAGAMALCAEAAGMNINNSKLAYVFIAKDKAQAQSFKKLFDNIQSGDPAAFADEKLFDAEGNPRWVMFNQNLKDTYIAPEIMADLHRFKAMFLTEIGIPNVNFEKRERLITGEVSANNTETESKASLWIEEMRRGMKQANDMFGLQLSVKMRFADEITDPEVRVYE